MEADKVDFKVGGIGAILEKEFLRIVGKAVGIGAM